MFILILPTSPATCQLLRTSLVFVELIFSEKLDFYV